jgi:hypothetical protein
MLSPVICSSCLLRSPSGKQDDGDQNDAENGSRDLGPRFEGAALVRRETSQIEGD